MKEILAWRLVSFPRGRLPSNRWVGYKKNSLHSEHLRTLTVTRCFATIRVKFRKRKLALRRIGSLPDPLDWFTLLRLFETIGASQTTLWNAKLMQATSKSCIAQIGNTPIRKIALLADGKWRPVYLKLEGCNPTGSSKDRTARALMSDLQYRGILRSSSIIIESTSGNLGASLAFVCREMGHRFVAVIDPKTTEENRHKIQQLGGELELVKEPDEYGGYLLSRLNRVHELCHQSPQYIWPDQYANEANPFGHFSTTGPELYSQMQGRVGVIFVAVSTGGTLAGVGRYFRENSPETKIVAVDAHGSVIFGGNPHARKLTGIGSSRRSNFIKSEIYDGHIAVNDIDAFSFCRQLDTDANIRVGGSSGAVLFACAEYLAEHPSIHNVVCICPDNGMNYESTIFNRTWLRDNGLHLKADQKLFREL